MHDEMEKNEAKKKKKKEKQQPESIKLHDAALMSFWLNAFVLLKRYIGYSLVHIKQYIMLTWKR